MCEMRDEKYITEGRAKIFFPRNVFYNPYMRLSRDIDVASVAAFCSFFNVRSLRCVDALAATGIRGIRLACEVLSSQTSHYSQTSPSSQTSHTPQTSHLSQAQEQGFHDSNACDVSIVVNDRSREAYDVIRRNIVMNNVEHIASASNEDANVLLHRHRYDIVDIDPFGSPAPFLDSACRSVRRLLLVTATDTAPLCGAHSGGVLKYDAIPLRTEYHREMGTRILLGKVVRELLKYRKSAIPLLCYAKRHFVRLVLLVSRASAKDAEKQAMHEIGFIAHCKSCGNRFSFPRSEIHNFRTMHKPHKPHDLSSTHRPSSSSSSCSSEMPPLKCDICGDRMRVAGPLFIGKIHHREFCEHVLREIERREELNERKNAFKTVERCKDELDIPYYYELHTLCRSLNVSPPPLSDVLASLSDSGFKVSRTHFSDTAFKTDANIREIKYILSEAAKGKMR